MCHTFSYTCGVSRFFFFCKSKRFNQVHEGKKKKGGKVRFKYAGVQGKVEEGRKSRARETEEGKFRRRDESVKKNWFGLIV